MEKAIAENMEKDDEEDVVVDLGVVERASRLVFWESVCEVHGEKCRLMVEKRSSLVLENALLSMANPFNNKQKKKKINQKGVKRTVRTVR